MLSIQKCFLAAGAALICLLVGPALSQDAAPQANTAPDNTKVNKKDRATSEPTADQGKNATSDREMMRKIRRAVVADKSLSSYAHNIKIISQSGKVTLKGPVHTDEEKKAIEAKATAIAGAGNVMNEITIKGDSK